ncbi:MAG: ABC transporter permease subunit [Bacteriovoracaceae bacterium]|jgi:dipeptide transport system permease protein|nr:ABC transporter permease subunit [Bacteriovoracaceae bacterium]
MIKFLAKKFFGLFPTLIGVSILSFVLIRLAPGDPVMLMLGERGADPVVYEQMKKNLGLDKPLFIQYAIFIKNISMGDLGKSIVSRRTVKEEFFDRFPATFELGFVALLIAIIFGIPLGIIAAIKKNGPIDLMVMGVSLAGYSMPIFWWGLILILIFSVTLGITPVAGRLSIMYDIDPITGLMLIDTWLSGEGLEAFIDAVKHLMLPAIAMGTIPLAIIARMTRSAMLEVLSEDYMRTAKAKGISPKKIIYVHGLRNALIPVVTVIGLMFGSIMTGAILTETIFSWPGIGKWMVSAVAARDYPVIQSGILIIAFMIIMINMLVDLVYAVINPKMRGQ